MLHGALNMLVNDFALFTSDFRRPRELHWSPKFLTQPGHTSLGHHFLGRNSLESGASMACVGLRDTTSHGRLIGGRERVCSHSSTKTQALFRDFESNPFTFQPSHFLRLASTYGNRPWRSVRSGEGLFRANGQSLGRKKGCLRELCSGKEINSLK